MNAIASRARARLIDLNPRWMDAGGYGITDGAGNPVAHQHGVGVTLDCPCGFDHRMYVPFSNPLEGPAVDPTRPLWSREGDTFETLTLAPSIWRKVENGGCGWHGFITNGEIKAA